MGIFIFIYFYFLIKELLIYNLLLTMSFIFSFRQTDFITKNKILCGIDNFTALPVGQFEYTV